MNSTSSRDHGALGALGAQLIGAVKELIENPIALSGLTLVQLRSNAHDEAKPCRS